MVIASWAFCSPFQTLKCTLDFSFQLILCKLYAQLFCLMTGLEIYLALIMEQKCFQDNVLDWIKKHIFSGGVQWLTIQLSLKDI